MRHIRVVEKFMELLASKQVNVGDPGSLSWAKRQAVHSAGYLAIRKAEAIESVFDRIWQNPGTTEYLARAWGIAVEAPNGDALTMYTRRLSDIAMNTDNERLAVDTIKYILKTLLPSQVHRVQSQSVIAHVTDPPAGYNDSPKMMPTAVLDPAANILPAQRKHSEQSGDDEDSDDDE